MNWLTICAPLLHINERKCPTLEKPDLLPLLLFLSVFGYKMLTNLCIYVCVFSQVICNCIVSVFGKVHHKRLDNSYNPFVEYPRLLIILSPYRMLEIRL